MTPPRSRSLGILPVVLAMALLSSPIVARAAPSVVADSLQIRRTTFRFNVRLDRIGLLFARPDSAAIAAVADSLHLVIRKQYPEGLVELSLPGPMRRDSLLQLVRSFRRTFASRVLNSGLVVYARGADRPMILTDRLVIQLRPGADSIAVDSLSKRLGARTLDRSRYFPGQRLLALVDSLSPDAIAASRQYTAISSVDYAAPDPELVFWLDQSPWTEPMYSRQWHLENGGSSGGTPDADIDARKAWDLTQGSSSVVVAVIDRGFDIHHVDLEPNLWVNDDPCDGHNGDDDHNGFVNDVHGVDFFGYNQTCGTSLISKHCVDCSFGPASRCSSSYPNAHNYDLDLSCEILVCEDMHGTAVAGLIAASGTNGTGVTGVAPGARLMLIRRSTDPYWTGQAFGYAEAEGASVINCSWHLDAGATLITSLSDAIVSAATNGRGGKGCVIAYAMSNEFNNDCSPTNPYSNSAVFGLTRSSDNEPAVIAVSGSDNQDAKVHNSGYGPCTSVLAPDTGTLKIATTDWTGPVGYNNTPTYCAECSSTSPESTDPEHSYTYCFSGTSASTAIVSGVAALILSADPDLTQPEVKRLLQDAADKVENESGAEPGSYDPETGFSTGTIGHGWGRANAFEAVRIAAPVSAGGKSGVDVFARDQNLDWGNTEQPSSTVFEPVRKTVGHWESVDIKVDAGPDWQPAPTTSAEFEAMADENPTPGHLNRVYVRVRNRGFRTAASVLVKLHWAYAGTALPKLPADFWALFPQNSTDVTDWHPVGTATLSNLEYSGSSAAADPATDKAQVAEIDFTAPPLGTEPTHYCLLVILDCEADRPGPMTRTPVDADRVVDLLNTNDNNVIQKNVVVMESTGGTFQFYVRNPGSALRDFQLRFVGIPDRWRGKLDPPGPYPLKPGGKILVTAAVRRPSSLARGRVVLVQQLRGARPAGPTLGGITVVFGPRTKAVAPDRTHSPAGR